MRRRFPAARRLRPRSAALAALIAAGAAGAVAGCGGSSDNTTSAGAAGKSSGAKSTQLALVAYSTPKKAYGKLIAAFEQSSAGEGITFSESFGASGAQSRAVDSGQPADVVNFSLEPDLTRLVKDGLVAKTWNANQYNGIVSDSVVVLVVRKGNPKHITGWDDLVKPGVDVVTPNPSTSGGARWNVLAGYGAQLKEGKTQDQALAYLKTLITKNVSVEDESAAAALHTFTSGKGDVLIDYESDAIAAEKAGDAVQYIVPKQTLLIQTPIAVLAKSSHQAQAQTFVNWLWSPAGQTIWANAGYRPVDKTVLAQFTSKFPTPADLFTIKFLGGWSKVKKTFFDPSKGIVTKLESDAGFPTASS